ncbi:MAG TPA: hypothetical protein VMW38_11100, partial [Terriglobia bacterium]|nr:hypothetical protein [Terriglobia bacterium]
VGRRSRAPAPRWPWASFFRPYRALRGTGGILPPDFSKNVQSPGSRPPGGYSLGLRVAVRRTAPTFLQ